MRRLRDILDKKNYLKLVKERGGARIWVPKIGNLGHRDAKYFAARDRKMRKLRKKNVAVRKIAASFGLSEKRVYGILKRGGKPRGKRGKRS